MEFKEIETKYSADSVGLLGFTTCIKALKPKSKTQVSSYDHYFVKSENEFIRYRAGGRPELTMKTKSNDKNNFVRTEVNLRLDADVSEEERLRTVEAFCGLLGFKHNFTIYKNCHIYYFDDCNIVYYIVYDEHMREQDRFIEIEMLEHGWESEAQAWSALQRMEKELAAIGITSQKRLKKSLFEMFRKA